VESASAAVPGTTLPRALALVDKDSCPTEVGKYRRIAAKGTPGRWIAGCLLVDSIRSNLADRRRPRVGLRQARFVTESAAERLWPSAAEGAARFSLGRRQAWGIHGPAKSRLFLPSGGKIPTACLRVVRLRATPEITVDRVLDDEGDDVAAAGAGGGVETVNMTDSLMVERAPSVVNLGAWSTALDTDGPWRLQHPQGGRRRRVCVGVKVRGRCRSLFAPPPSREILDSDVPHSSETMGAVQRAAESAAGSRRRRLRLRRR
jgi:hypothetical protein